MSIPAQHLPLKKKKSYLAVLGLSCSTWNLPSSLWQAESLVAAGGIFSRGMRDLSPWPGIEPGSPVLGVQSLSHWPTEDLLGLCLLTIQGCCPLSRKECFSWCSSVSAPCSPDCWPLWTLDVAIDDCSGAHGAPHPGACCLFSWQVPSGYTPPGTKLSHSFSPHSHLWARSPGLALTL